MDNKSVSDEALTPQSHENPKNITKARSRRNPEFSKFLESKNLNILGKNSPNADTPKFFANNLISNTYAQTIKQSVFEQKSPKARSPHAKDSLNDSEWLLDDDVVIQANSTG
jgi:hypothetical protein